MRRAGFVLAGGASSRMGRDKALLDYQGMALAAWVASRVEAAAGRVSLVGGGEKYVHLGYPVLNERYADCGPLSGIEAALRLGGAEWSLVVACDMAGVQTGWLAGILDAAGGPGIQAVCVRQSGGAIEPLCAVYHESCLGPVQALLESGVYKASALFSEINGLALDAKWAGELRNVNTPEDWEAVKHHS
ncbi:MAG TPA: molybdenum cofactor guanylyltransferase [Bryobacteraceae bacterium]|nr:molybdenum cofactor guanylyltransferase [Bryobacteraceae bacterium]HPT26714.1 molybdenum cofactor guanylyltransferase [Bryobacteraceae bacterium]